MRKLLITLILMCMTILVGCTNTHWLPSNITVTVPHIEDMRPDFVLGHDVSALDSMEDSGMQYHDYHGNTQDAITTLAHSGTNYVRLRLWNDPQDSEGNYYGGGNCDIDTVSALGVRTTNNGMSVILDYHYSDFWADPANQRAPKAWQNLSIQDKCTAIYQYTHDTLQLLIERGVDVSIVQIGNEINSGMIGILGWDNNAKDICTLLMSAYNAVKAVDSNIDVAIHFAHTSTSDIMYYANILSTHKVQYDILALSYYSYWHGSLQELSTTMDYVSTTYNKDVLIVETAYPYTLDDLDNSGNNISIDNINDLHYPISAQGQATALYELIECVHSCPTGLGVIYWESTWTALGDSYQDNMPLWQQYGSGWTTKYAQQYDPHIIATHGCSWENQAMWDSKGYPLHSLLTYYLVRYGTP